MTAEVQEDVPGSWMESMRRGDWEQAWKFSDKELQRRAGTPCWQLPRHLQYIWDGTPIAGKRVLVRCYHGLGDSIQFIRYMPLLKSVASEVIVWSQSQLIDLFKVVPGIDLLLPLHNGSPDVNYDADLEIMELPHVFRTTLDTIPRGVPYLHVEPMLLSSDRQRLAVGLVWKAGDWDQKRDLPFSLLAPLAEINGINLYIMQAGAKKAGWQEGFGINPGEFTLYEYAQVVKGLDLLISVDSMPAHLAGALGVPVWTLLQATADWRWIEGREDSPWYPSMRLFKQDSQADWQPVIARVKSELENLCRAAAVSGLV